MDSTYKNNREPGVCVTGRGSFDRVDGGYDGQDQQKVEYAQTNPQVDQECVQAIHGVV